MKNKHCLPALALALTLVTGMGTVSAEQAAAETNRQIFSSKNFTLKYSEGKEQYTVSESGGSRAVVHSRKGKPYYRTVFSNGNYYYIEQGDNGLVAAMLPADELDNPALDPDENWHSHINNLSLPQALLVLDWTNPFNNRPASWDRPEFTSSSQQTIAKQNYDIDIYVSNVRTVAGNVVGQVIYRLGYQAGVLKLVEVSYRRDGVETVGKQYTIDEISASAPENLFGDKSVDLRAAGLGDMNNLLNQPTIIGKIGGKTNANKE